MDAQADEQLAERYVVVPAVDVEALRAALRTVAVPGVTLALGPSLLGTLDMDALPVGMHPFVDPDRRVRPLRDDVVLLVAGAGPTGADALAGLADLVERRPLVLDPSTARGPGVLVLGRSEGPDGVRLDAEMAPDPAGADRLLPVATATWFQGPDGSGRTSGADLYVVLPQDRLADVLAPRDG